MTIENLAHFVDDLASGVEFEEFGLVTLDQPESSLHSGIVAAGFSSELNDKLYRWFNGQNGSVNLFGEFQLLSFEESMVQWDDNHSYFGNDKSESCSSRIQPSYGYFDGPFDQVPPFLDIRDKLHIVYPYLKDQGIDLHGNFLNQPGVRVAVSPYQQYENLSDIELFIEKHIFLGSPDEPEFVRFVYESKMDFHKKLSKSLPADSDMVPPDKSMRGEIEQPETTGEK